MSLTLGQNLTYINTIENRKSYPSFPMFFNICEYFGITPMEFFNINNKNPIEIAELISSIYPLNSEEIGHLKLMANDVIKYKLKGTNN